MKHAINWFEIPVLNFEAAVQFYESIFQEKFPIMEAMGMKSAFFPAEMEQGAIGGCLIKGPGYEPSVSGPLIYLNGGNDLMEVLKRVEGAGGKILLNKKAIGHNGFMAIFQDTEGNRIGLHSRS